MSSGLVNETDPRGPVAPHPGLSRRYYTLTAAGRRALARAPSSTQERLIAAVVQMTPTMRRTAGRALAAMADAIRIDQRPPMFFEERGTP
jgi:DNA-binding PadR family transcriptional regulator